MELWGAFDRASMTDKQELVRLCSSGDTADSVLLAAGQQVSVGVRNFLLRYMLACESDRTSCARKMVSFAHELGLLSSSVSVASSPHASDATCMESTVETGTCADCPACRWKKLPSGASLSFRIRQASSGKHTFRCVDWNKGMVELLTPEIIEAGKLLLMSLSTRGRYHLYKNESNSTLIYNVALVCYTHQDKMYHIKRA